MSAFIVEDETISAVLYFYQWAKMERTSTFIPDEALERYEDGTPIEPGLEDLGQIILDENYRAVNYRYRNETGKAHKFKLNKQFKALHQYKPTIEPLQCVKLINCIQYQLAEPDDYKSTKAYELLDLINSYAVESIPGYGDLPWSEPDDPRNPPRFRLNHSIKMIKNNTNLAVVCCDEEQQKRHSYRYLVQCSATPHTAFRTKEALYKYIDERGLRLDKELPEPGTWEVIDIIGTYREISHLSYDYFYDLRGVVCETRTLSNGRYTLARITDDYDGNRTVHTMNPNNKYRIEYDHQESEKLKNLGEVRA